LSTLQQGSWGTGTIAEEERFIEYLLRKTFEVEENLED
jgi:hypothetical protein